MNGQPINNLSPQALMRPQRAANDIQNQAVSSSRHPHNLFNMSAGRGINWPFNAADLLQALDRAGLTVTVKQI